MTAIEYRTYQKTIQDILNLYEDGHLNLEPGFQRSSVWAERDRAKLIDSILPQLPVAFDLLLSPPREWQSRL